MIPTREEAEKLLMQFTALSGRHSVLERPPSGAKRPLIFS